MAQWNPKLPTLQQSIPGLGGARAGQDLMRAYLQNQAMQQANQAAPDMNAARLAQMLAQTEGRQLTTKQMPERLGLDEYKATIMAQNAARGLQNIQLQNQKMDAYYANAMARNAASQPGMIAQALDPAAAQGALAGSSGFAQRFGKRFDAPGTASAMPPGAQAPGVEAPQFPAMQQFLAGQQQPGAPGADQIGQAQPQQPQQPQMQPQAPQPQQAAAGGVPDEMIKALQDAQMSASIKKTSTAQIINQGHYSLLLDDLITRVTPNMTIAIKAYSGPGGTARLKKDQIKSMLPGGKVTPELEAFNRVKNVATQFLANEVTRSLGEAHNLATAEEMRKLANPIHWTTNPALALSQWDEFIKNSKQVSKTLSKSVAQTRKALGETDVERPQAQPQTISSAPSGTVEMIDEQGRRRAVPSGQLNDALNHGWSRG